MFIHLTNVIYELSCAWAAAKTEEAKEFLYCEAYWLISSAHTSKHISDYEYKQLRATLGREFI